MSEDDGRVPKRSKNVDLAKLVGDHTETERLQKQMKAAESLLDPAGRLAATHAAHIFPDVSLSAGAAEAARLADSYRLPDLAALGLADVYKVPDSAWGEAVGKAHLGIMDSFRLGSLSDMIGSQGALAALAPSLGLIEQGAFAGLLDGVRARQSAISAALEGYLDQQQTQAERIAGLMQSLAMPRIDIASIGIGIGSALALGDSNAFRIAGLTPDYAEQYRSIFGAVNERISVLAGLGVATNVFALQPDLVGGISSLLERALAQQEALLVACCRFRGHRVRFA